MNLCQRPSLPWSPIWRYEIFGTTSSLFVCVVILHASIIKIICPDEFSYDIHWRTVARLYLTSLLNTHVTDLIGSTGRTRGRNVTRRLYDFEVILICAVDRNKINNNGTTMLEWPVQANKFACCLTFPVLRLCVTYVFKYWLLWEELWATVSAKWCHIQDVNSARGKFHLK